MNPADVEAAPFVREERYIVVKRKHLSAVQETALRAHMDRLAIGTVECVVIESDWPEYETVWRMIERRTTLSTQAPMPAASGEPFAWFYEIPGSGVWRLYRCRYSDPQHVAQGWTETPLYAAPPVQAPMPGEVGELAERLTATRPRYDQNTGKHMFDVFNNPDGADAVALIQSLQREVEAANRAFESQANALDYCRAERDALRNDVQAMSIVHANDKIERERLTEELTAAQRVKEEAVGLIQSMEHDLGHRHDGARAFIKKHGGGNDQI